MSFNVSYKNLKITVHTNTNNNNNNNNISIENMITTTTTTTTTHSDTKNDIVTVQHNHQQQGIGSKTNDSNNNDLKSPASELKPIWIEQERRATTGRNDRQLDTIQPKTQGMIRKNQSSSMTTTPATSNNSRKYASILNMKRSIDSNSNTSTKSDVIMNKKKGRTTSIITHHNEEDKGKKQKQHQAISLSSMNDTTSSIIRLPSLILQSLPSQSPPLILPSPDCGNDMDPDEFLLQLVTALFPNVQLKVKSSLKLTSYFPIITEEQVLRYNVEIVQIARSNNIKALQEYYNQHGRESLNCFNRFGEGLLNMACRRGFVDMVRFLLSSEIQLPVRVRDDGGRTPMHDACWNPEPQIDICTWIIQKDPSLLLVADQRGYTPFQYARKSDWPIWRKFVVHNLDQIRILGTNEDIITTFS